MDRTNLVISQAADDDEDATGAGLGGFEDLIRVHHEVLADARARHGEFSLILDDLDEVKFMMGRLKASGQKRKKNRSYADLRDLQSVGSPFANEMNSSQMRVDYSSSNVSRFGK
jgi:hypothetical protein